MKITGIYIYPVKGLRGVPLASAELTPQGLKYDRRFMLWRLADDGSLEKKIQVNHNPECALFHQEVVDETGISLSSRSSSSSDDTGTGAVATGAEPNGIPQPNGNHSRKPQESKALATDSKGADRHGSSGNKTIVIRYLTPEQPLLPPTEAHNTPLRIPLEPDPSSLSPVAIDMYGSAATVHRMGDPYDAWFTACLGFPAALLYIGDGRRPQLGFAPAKRAPQPNLLYLILASITGLFTSLLSLVGLGRRGKRDWIAFSDLAPYLIVSQSSLSELAGRISGPKPIGMHRFRPNIVVGPSSSPGDKADEAGGGGGDLPAWDEDFWNQISLDGHPTFQITGNCTRCTSINVDYATGRFSDGERGAVLKKLMGYRRVDPGKKMGAVFGRYASLASPERVAGTALSVGDEVGVSRRNAERDVYDWPDWNKK